MRALVVGIDLETAREIGELLEAAWPSATVLLSETAAEAMNILADERADLVLLGDAVSGGALAWTSALCERAHGPVLMIAHRNRWLDEGYVPHLGVTDVLWRPVSVERLRARITSALARECVACHEEPPTLEAGTVTIDYAAASVSVGGTTIDLDPTEYGLLYHLSRNANRVLSARTLLGKVWGRDYIEDFGLLDAQVESLGRKLGYRRAQRPRIAVRRGVGYVFEIETGMFASDSGPHEVTGAETAGRRSGGGKRT